MKKLIFCCLVVLMGSCKDKDDKVEPETNFTSDFLGSYWTKTATVNFATDHAWEVTEIAKNQLGILYTKTNNVTISGQQLTGTQEYTLINVVTTAKNVFTINEVVDVKQSTGQALKQKLEGTGEKVVGANGVPQINITMKMTNVATGAVSEEYLEFKKK